jgi:tetratricopeptide (TPR) repeat protein
MESGEVEALIECLVANPHDTDALARAHRQGEVDPQGYAYLLEQVGTRTTDPSYASHWLSEAANIWSVTLGDAHRAARVLMIAVDRDPTQPLAANRLAQLYRDKGDIKALVAMLDRRVRLLTPILAAKPQGNDELRGLIAGLHEELGKAWNEPPLDQPRKAIDHYKRSIELDPTSAFAIFSLREIYKSLQQWDEALSMYALELAVERDPARRLMLSRDEAATRRLAGDLAGVTQVLRSALDEVRGRGADDPVLAQEVAGSILDRAEARAPLDERERAYGADLLAGLAETFDGEHGLAYAGGALDLVNGHDRAMQLYAYYASATGAGQSDALSLRYHAYLQASPQGPLAKEASLHLSISYESLGQIAQAVQVLQPLRGHAEIDQRLAALQSQLPAPTGQTPVVGVHIDEAGTYANASGGPSVDTEEVEEVAAPPLAHKLSALEAARASVAKGDKTAALERYLEVLADDPVEPEALSWVEDALRAKRDYAKLREVLWASARAMGSHDSVESRKLRLREIAGLSESNLKDSDGAILAWRQVLAIDRGDDAARQSLTRALEKSQRWDDLANVYEQDASTTSDTDAKIQLEKKLATLHEQKRNDLVAAGEAWSRIASLTPDDDHAVVTAADFFEKAGKHDLAAQTLDEHADAITDVGARAALLDRLGKLYSRAGSADFAAAGKAYRRAAEAEPTQARWEATEQAFAGALDWPTATTAAERAAALVATDAPTAKAEVLARASKYQSEAGDEAAATALLEQAHKLAPAVESYGQTLAERYRAGGEVERLAELLVARGEGNADAAVRIAASREAAKLYEAPPLSNDEAAATQWQKVLLAGEDAEALEHLVRIAIAKDDLAHGAALLRRLGSIASTNDEKVAVALREAELLARGSGAESAQAAVERYEWVLETLEPTSRAALRAIAALEEKRSRPEAAAKALERELTLAQDPTSRREIATRLVRNYEAANDDAGTFGALRALREADPEDFDVLNRLVSLAEKLERWEALVELLAEQIEVEADDGEIATLTQRRAALLADKLGRGDDALAALQEVADAGDDGVRAAYVALGDTLGWRGIVATKLVEWHFPEAPSDARTAALVGAFERFAVVGRDVDAVKVGVEILRTSRDAKVVARLAEQLEELAAKTSNEAGLTAAQEVLGVELNGVARASELVRQAEMRVRAGMAWAESVQHGETALGGLTADEAEPLLVRLAALIQTSTGVVDLYERQVSRARGGEARERALIKAATVAGARNELKRARTFFDLAVSGTPSDATLDALHAAIHEGSNAGDARTLQRALADAMAHGGEGVRDGGRARANLLRRAAVIAAQDLDDADQAFTWLTESLVAHADTATLDAVASLAEATKAPRRIDEVITKVLTEVFDGPLVRLLLTRRVKVRKDLLDDRVGAAADLKKLHDLSPTDESVMSELSALLIEQGDHRAMIQLYEDQILRSKDQAVRAELGRKVAQTWEGELADPREAADAWRRVLRLKPGDEEATQGLDRSKTNMLRKGPAPAAVATSPATSAAPTSAPKIPVAKAVPSAPATPMPSASATAAPSPGSAPSAVPPPAAVDSEAEIPAPTSSVPTVSAVAPPATQSLAVPPPAAVAAASSAPAPLSARSLAGPPPLPQSTPSMQSAPTLSSPALSSPMLSGVPVPAASSKPFPLVSPAKQPAPAATTPARLNLVPEPPTSVLDLDDGDLEAELGDLHDAPQLEKLLGSTDPFAEADTTHTAIDVRMTRAAALSPEKAPEASPAKPKPSQPPQSSRGVPSSRGSKPPPLPSNYELNEPPTSPGRRLDVPAIAPDRLPISDRALAMTDENAPVDFTDQTVVGELPRMSTPDLALEPPPDILSATELVAFEDDDEDDDVLVVDEFVEDIDDEFEDVAEPSKPPGPMPH